MATLSLLDTILQSTMKRQVAKRTMTIEDYQKAFSHPSLAKPDGFNEMGAIDIKTIK